MAMERFYSEFQPTSQEQQELFKVLKSMMESDLNLNLKTEIDNPLAHSTLDLIGFYAKMIKQDNANTLIEFFSKSVKEQMVSKRREGRKEFTQVLSAGMQRLIEQGRSLGDRMTGRGKE